MWGPHAGKLIVASEGSGLIRAIDTSGNITVLNPTNLVPGGPEELSFIPLNLGASGNPVEGFYGSRYTPNVIKVPAADFAGLQGDAIVTAEFSGQVFQLHWNGIGLDITPIGSFGGQPEDGLFVTAAIIQGAPEPGTLLLLGSGLLALGGFAWRRHRRS